MVVSKGVYAVKSLSIHSKDPLTNKLKQYAVYNVHARQETAIQYTWVKVLDAF